MKNRTATLLLSFCISLFSRAQEFGYHTLDLGGEFQWSPSGTFYNLQVDLNSKIHHSFLIRAGFTRANPEKTSLHDKEEGNGWGGSLGYRYYFSVLPKRFFLGARAELWTMDLRWALADIKGSSRLLVFQPSLETGYTFLVNDYLFITPYITAGNQFTLHTKGGKASYGQGFNSRLGISVGWRF